MRTLRLEPLRLGFPRARLVIVRRGGVDDGVVVDRQNGIEVAEFGLAHLDHRCLPAHPLAVDPDDTGYHGSRTAAENA